MRSLRTLRQARSESANHKIRLLQQRKSCQGLRKSKRTLEAIGESLSRVPACWHRTEERIVYLVVIGIGLQRQAPDTAGLHAATAASPPKTSASAHGRLLLEGVGSRDLDAAGPIHRGSSDTGAAVDGATSRGVGALYAAHIAVGGG